MKSATFEAKAWCLRCGSKKNDRRSFGSVCQNFGENEQGEVFENHEREDEVRE